MSLDNRKSSQEIRLKLLLPVMQEDKPYQSVQIMNMSPRPCSEIKDRWGNRIAEYSITLPPGDHKDIVIDYRVRLCNYVTDIDWEKIPLRCEYPEEVRPFLLPEGHIESDNPLMKNLSSGITEGEPHSYFQALKIYDHIMDECTFELEREPQSALSALKSRVVQCCDSTLLFIALCRARGIPARYIGGLYLGLEEGDEYDCTHCWAQVYMPAYGWIDADPTQGRHSDERRFCLLRPEETPLFLNMERDEGSLSNNDICPVRTEELFQAWYSFQGGRNQRWQQKIHQNPSSGVARILTMPFQVFTDLSGKKMRRRFPPWRCSISAGLRLYHAKGLSMIHRKNMRKQ